VAREADALDMPVVGAAAAAHRLSHLLASSGGEAEVLEGQATIAQIAHSVGCEPEVAFDRALRRTARPAPSSTASAAISLGGSAFRRVGHDISPRRMATPRRIGRSNAGRAW
jgi:hypothetical protein